MSDINNGLQLYFQLNEVVKNAAGEQQVVDLSSGKVNGKLLGNPTVVADSHFGKCLKFNGNDDGILINPMNNFPSNAITVLCWIKSNNKQKAGTVLSYAKSLKYSYNEFQVHDIRNLTPTVNNKWYETKVAYNEGEWHCVAVTWQSSNGILKVYKDGKEEHSGIISAGQPIATGGAVVVGQEQDLLAGGFSASQAFEGQMAHLRIYNRVLSPTEISECMKADETPPPKPEEKETASNDINKGLQLHLKLNEIVKNAAAEQQVIDLSSGKVNGKVLGNPAIVADSRFGSCISFDGVDNYVELPPTTIPTGNEITISFWANGGSSLPKQNSIILAEDKDNNRVVNIHLPWSDGQIFFDCGNQSGVYDRIEKLAVASDFKEKWTHWVFTKNATTGEMKIYLNGILWQSGTGKNKQLTPITKIRFGTGYGAYHGKVAHLRIYNRVLSPAEIQQCMIADETLPPDINKGLQLHLKLNEIVKNAAAEQQVIDLSSGKVNGKVLGNPAVVADSRFGSCLNFDGVDDYVELPPTTIPTGNEITISFWANGGSSLPKQNSIILAEDKDNNRVVNIHLPWSESQVVFDCGNQGNTYDRIEKLAVASDFKEKWTHWVFTKNAITGEMKIYLNGILWQSGTGKNKQLTPITKIRFGTGYGAYHGKVAHLRIYNRVLSPAEIQQCMIADETAVSNIPTTDSSDDVSEDIQTTEQKPIVDIPTTTDSSDDVDADDSDTADETDVDAEDDDSETADETDADDDAEDAEDDDSDTADETDADETDADDDAEEDSDTADETDADAAADSKTADQKPMEYQIYQVNGNPTIQTGYKASEWTAIIAGFNCGAKNQKSGTGLTIMPIVDNGEWKIKCDIKNADDKYWDVAVLFIRNNMVNRLNNFHR